MSEYSELIKKFDKIRDYMRDFYVYGFLSREDFEYRKSLRTYDDEKRRIESWLSEYIAFRMDENGKSVFLSLDSANIPENPFYRAFKAKSFTKNDITLNFLLLDILWGDTALTASEIADIIAAEYMPSFEKEIAFDLSTVRNKLSEYTELGILKAEKQGRKLLFSRRRRGVDWRTLYGALPYFSEVSPLGVIGSYLLDKFEDKEKNRFLSFKHHYIMHALESEILYSLLTAMHRKQTVEVVNFSPHQSKGTRTAVIPLKILVSVQGGRRYLAACDARSGQYKNYRLDSIKAVHPVPADETRKPHGTYGADGMYGMYGEMQRRLHEILSHTWGASYGRAQKTEHLEMLLCIPQPESYIVNRILREGRFGILLQLDETTYKYEIDVYDAAEMLPWLRTFLGRILSLTCDNKSVESIFYGDFDALCAMYGGDGDAVL